ncbi:unnamed protein product [Closterium sp. Naga37s-1]|nr:unnamed protein product [Closterium sp. Naga37s-1]
MAPRRATGASIEEVKEAVLAALREGSVAHKGEVNELRRMLTVLKKENKVTAAVMEERERQLEAVKGELASVKGQLASVKGELGVVKREMAEHKVAMADKLAESGRALGVKGLNGKRKKRRQAGTEECAPEEERGREVQGVDRPRAMEEERGREMQGVDRPRAMEEERGREMQGVDRPRAMEEERGREMQGVDRPRAMVEERGREVQGVDRPRAMEELAAFALPPRHATMGRWLVEAAEKREEGRWGWRSACSVPLLPPSTTHKGGGGERGGNK